MNFKGIVKKESCGPAYGVIAPVAQALLLMSFAYLLVASSRIRAEGLPWSAKGGWPHSSVRQRLQDRRKHSTWSGLRPPMNARLTTQHDLTAEAQALVQTLATAWGSVRLAAAAGGLVELAAEWQRHVREVEEHLFPRLIAESQAADAPVGFCMAEHAALNARLATLGPVQPTPEWLREAERVIGGLVQHLFLEARILQPFVDRLYARPVEPRRDGRQPGREEA